VDCIQRSHVTIWEQEAIKYLPLIIEGGVPLRYSTYGGIDAFNERMMGERLQLPLLEVRKQLGETHRQLIDLIKSLPEDQ
jgi:hypothetical protein